MNLNIWSQLFRRSNKRRLRSQVASDFLEVLENRVLLAATSNPLDGGDIQEIVNGNDDWSYTAVGRMVVNNGAWTCTGTLISPTHVLTAAHCVMDNGNQIADTAVTFQVHNTNGTLAGTYTSSKVVVHPRYNDFNFGAGYDLAIVELSQPVQGIVPMQILRSAPQQGETLTLVGYGDAGTTNNFNPSEQDKQLGTTPLETVTNLHLEWIFNGNGEANTAPGDSGGPAFVQRGQNFYIAGITSGGAFDAFAPGGDSFDTRVDVFAQWIDSNSSVGDQQATIGSDLIGRAGNTWWVAQSNGTSAFTNQNYGNWNANTDVLMGDFNNDGVTDVAGRTSTGQWWVGVNSPNGFVNQLWGSWVPSLNWTDVHAADVDGDGDTDIVGRASTGDWWVARSNGGSFSNERWGRWSPNVTWSNVMVADVNGDGNDDIIGQTPNGQWWAARSNGAGAFVTEHWGWFNPNANFQDIQVGDFNGDGNDDVAGWTGNGAWWVGVSNGTNGFTNQNWGSWAASANWQNVMVADLNGDGNDDIIGRAQNGQWWAAESTGSSFSRAYWGYWVPSLNWQDVNVIDVDQDGNHDLVGRAANGGLWVARSNGQNFTNQNWGFWNPNANWQNVMVGNTQFGGNGSDQPIAEFDDDDDQASIFG